MLNHHQPTAHNGASGAGANLSARAKHFSIDSLINKDPATVAAVAAAMAAAANARFNGIPWPAAAAVGGGAASPAVGGGQDNAARKRSSTEVLQNRSKRSKLDMDDEADADEDEMINVDDIDGQSVGGTSSQEDDFGSCKSTDGRSPTPNITFADSFASSFGKCLEMTEREVNILTMLLLLFRFQARPTHQFLRQRGRPRTPQPTATTSARWWWCPADASARSWSPCSLWQPSACWRYDSCCSSCAQ